MKKINLRKSDKNPKGGLSAKGRARINRSTGSNLKAPIKGRPSTPSELRRKGSFLVRMGSVKGELMKDGKKTRLKLALEAWGHKGDKSSAVAKGKRFLQRLRNMKD